MQAAIQKLTGGFFVNIQEPKSGEVRDLLTSIKRDRAEMLDFAAAITEAEDLVRQSATGFDLTPLYPKPSPILSGPVEIAYDDSNQPAMRYIEPLIYEISAYTEDRQPLRLSQETGFVRPFIKFGGRAFLGMECAGAPLTWAHGALGAAEAYVYAMGEETWLVGARHGHLVPRRFLPAQAGRSIMTWCADHGIKSDHLFGQHEWRW
jgi:hypothetical protein